MLRHNLLGVLRLLFLAALIALAWCVIRWAPVAAQDSDARLRELVAKVSYNEAGDSYDDLALIWQTVEGRGSTTAERVRWLEAHSSCVSGRLSQDLATLRPGRCRWTRNLRPDGRLPRGWPGSQADWRRERPRWLAHLVAVRAFVDGEDPYRPCAVAPESWDGDRPSWRARAEARGWVRVECEGNARNAGYRRAATSGSDS